MKNALIILLLWSCAGSIAWGDDAPVEAIAPAKEFRGSYNQARMPLRLLRAPEIQTELGLDSAQVKAITAAAEPVDVPGWQLRDAPPGRQAEPLRKYYLQFDAAWRQVLKPAQQKRFDQILLRADGWHSLLLPSVVGQLQLDDNQRTRYGQFIEAVKQRPPRSLAELGRSEYQWIQAVLSESQRVQMRELLGAAFDFEHCRAIEAKAPEIQEVETWINTPPLTLASLKGKVVVFHFWTFGCINCIHNLPIYRAWHSQWTNGPVVVLGMHTPETKDEYNIEALRKSVAKRQLEYLIAVDNRHVNWKAWGNNMWPSTYLIDKQGFVRYWWYGELNWRNAHLDRQVQDRIAQLLAEKTP